MSCDMLLRRVESKVRVVDKLTQLCAFRCEKNAMHGVLSGWLNRLIDILIWLIDDAVEIIGIRCYVPCQPSSRLSLG